MSRLRPAVSICQEPWATRAGRSYPGRVAGSEVGISEGAGNAVGSCVMGSHVLWKTSASQNAEHMSSGCIVHNLTLIMNQVKFHDKVSTSMLNHEDDQDSDIRERCL